MSNPLLFFNGYKDSVFGDSYIGNNEFCYRGLYYPVENQTPVIGRYLGNITRESLKIVKYNYVSLKLFQKLRFNYVQRTSLFARASASHLTTTPVLGNIRLCFQESYSSLDTNEFARVTTGAPVVSNVCFNDYMNGPKTFFDQLGVKIHNIRYRIHDRGRGVLSTLYVTSVLCLEKELDEMADLHNRYSTPLQECFNLNETIDRTDIEYRTSAFSIGVAQPFNEVSRYLNTWER